MTEDWFEDELPWLGPPPQLPPRREQPHPAPARRTPPRRPVGLPAMESPADVPYPTGRAPRRTPGAVPPFAESPHPPAAQSMVFTWAGIALVALAVITGAALILRDVRATPASSPPPVSQLVIPANTDSGAESNLAAIVPNAAFQGKVICLDAAHGGPDRGFRRVGDLSAPAMDESLYTSAYVRELAAQLTAMGFTVALTRDGDTVRNSQYQDVNRDGRTRENASNDAEAQRNALLDEMQARIDYCNDQQADLFLSLHFDGSTDPSTSGPVIWYSENRDDSPHSQRLASLIDQELGLAHVSTGQGIQPESSAAVRGTQAVYDSLFVITGARDGLKAPARMPGVVADLLTISNTEDAKLLSSGAGRSAIVSAVAQAIGLYFDGGTSNG